MSADIPQPLNNIGCQELLSEEYVHCGWVRKRSFINKIGRFRWPQVYMILSNACVYYFKNEYSKTLAGKFSLYGYNSVSRETELSVKQAPCAFKIVHLHQDEFKTYYFATASEKEMKEWMKHIKGQMVTANGKKADNYYYTYRHAGSINRTPDDDVKYIRYKDLEENIYEDSTVFKPSNDYAAKFKVKHKDDVSDDEDISDAPPPPPRRPQFKERPPQPLPDLPVTEPSHQEPAGGSSGRRSPYPYSKKNTEDAKDHRSKSKNEDKSVKGAEKSFSIFDDTTNKQLQNELSGRLKKQVAAASPKSNHSTDESHGNTTRKRSKEIDQAPEVDKRKGSAGNVTKINKERQAETSSRLTADDNEDDDDSQSYWESIYYNDSNKEKAQEIIRNIGEDGVFLIRRSEDGGQVLVVFADNMPKKYKINNEGDDYFLKKNGPHAESVEMLMYIYHEECLPTATVKLTIPYKLHKSYSRVR